MKLGFFAISPLVLFWLTGCSGKGYYPKDASNLPQDRLAVIRMCRDDKITLSIRSVDDKKVIYRGKNEILVRPGKYILELLAWRDVDMKTTTVLGQGQLMESSEVRTREVQVTRTLDCQAGHIYCWDSREGTMKDLGKAVQVEN